MPVSMTSKPICGLGVSGGSSRRTTSAHAAQLGELDGVAQQVDEDLAKARRIGMDRSRDRPAVLDLQGEAFRIARTRMRETTSLAI